MNVKAFRNKVKFFNRDCAFSNLSYGGLEWPEWYKLANMTRNIDYGCRFSRQVRDGSVDGYPKCEKQREYKYTDEMCCCSICYNSLGYLRFIQNDLKVIKRIAGLFRPEIGFWRKGKGCILPRKYRSAVCLGYRCESAEKYKVRGTSGMLVLFMDTIRLRRLSDKNIRILGRALLKSI